MKLPGGLGGDKDLLVAAQIELVRTISAEPRPERERIGRGSRGIFASV